MSGLIQKLIDIQGKLKAPKGQFNSFGNYSYRSCEDILEAVKPLLREHGCALTISDELVNKGERYHIRATVTLWDCDTGDKLEASAFAREEESKKGMDASQITGSCSSYARKYALNGLFCIDDTRDSDGTNTHGKQPGADDSDLDTCPACNKRMGGIRYNGKNVTGPEFISKMGMCYSCYQASRDEA